MRMMEDGSSTDTCLTDHAEVCEAACRVRNAYPRVTCSDDGNVLTVTVIDQTFCRASLSQGKERTNSHIEVTQRKWGGRDRPGSLRTTDIPLIHFASGSWILKSSLKRSSTVTFFF